MDIVTSYKVKIKHYNHIFKDTLTVYRKAVDYLIDVICKEWDTVSRIDTSKSRVNYVELLCHNTKGNIAKYDFDAYFYKFPSYLRRSAIMEALGKISSYKSNLNNGTDSGYPKAGYCYPAMYKDNVFVQTSDYTAKIKVFHRNDWVWLDIDLKKSDMDYIKRHCSNRKKTVPTLIKCNKEWYLRFAFEEKASLPKTDVKDQIAVAVDLGINTAATISVISSDGTILGRYFCHLNKEIDHLTHSINRIKKAQQHGNRKTPRLWTRTKGINHDISVKTAQFITDIAVLYNADVIVFEHLDRKGKLHGSKKQKLHMWRSQEVQAIVTNKAHRLGIRISRICAWGTSKFAYDGSGIVLRGKDADLATYSVCKFTNGKIYNCDLSASYNIGARYFIREILKSESEKTRLQLEAKVPQVCKRSTCTFSSLISLNAVLASI